MIIPSHEEMDCLGEDYARGNLRKPVCEHRGFLNNDPENYYICTRKFMHKGMHVAHANNRVVAMWSK